MKLSAATLLLLLLPVIGAAHHSRAEFSDEVEELRGEIVSARWTNPHPELTLRVEGEGELLIQVYGAANNLRQAGVTDELFEIGDRVTIAGQRSIRRAGLVLGTHMMLADGRQAIFSRTLEPRWSAESVGGMEAFMANASGLADALSENRGFFRVWSVEPAFDGTSGVTRYLPLTEAAIVGQAAYDPLTSRLGRGEVPGMPAFMQNRNHFEIFDEGDTIRYEQPVYGIVRTIHMNAMPDDGADLPHSKLGYSVGRMEGNTLIVETTRLNWPYANRTGIPLSEQVELVERFTLSEDQARLDFHLTITDPVNFTEPATYTRYWVALESPPPEEPYRRE